MARRVLFSCTSAVGLCLALVIYFSGHARGADRQIPGREPTPSTTHCVKPGVTYPPCYPSIQQAINAATAGDTISVGVGTYNEHIQVNKNLQIIGHGWDNTIINGGSSSATPVVQVLPGIDATTLISGFQVTGGGTGITATSSNSGGGINIQYASPVIENTWVYANTAHEGGGVYAALGSPQFINVPAWSNKSATYGGGFSFRNVHTTVSGNPFDPVYTTNGTVALNEAGYQVWDDGGGFFIYDSEVTMFGLRIYSNIASSGGGIYLYQNTSYPVLIALNDISWNTATNGGGGIGDYNSTHLTISANVIGHNSSTGTGQGGGGIRLLSSKGTVNLNLISDNTTHSPEGTGGGIQLGNTDTQVLIRDNTIQNNTSGEGGGIGMFSVSGPTIDCNVIIQNTAGIGGGIYTNDTANVTITNNIVAQNIISAGGGGSAGGVAIVDSTLKFINNTVADNSKDGVLFFSSEGVVIENNIISGNAEDGLERYILNPTTVYTADYNDVYNNGTNYNNLSPGAHDKSWNPLFVGGSGSLFDYYHIQNSSPVSTTGTFSPAPVYDIDHQVRKFSTTNSMGADKPGLTTPLYVYLPLIRK